MISGQIYIDEERAKKLHVEMLHKGMGWRSVYMLQIDKNRHSYSSSKPRESASKVSA